MALKIKEYIDNQPVHVDEEAGKKAADNGKGRKKAAQKAKKQTEKNSKGAKN